eukprot:4497788-Pyramimonas_sp.AAC.1
MYPQELLEHDWLQLANARCVAPRGPTCMQAVPAATLAYFLVYGPMLHGVAFEVGVSQSAVTWPRRPARLTLAKHTEAPIALELDEPRPFPRRPPVGCARFPWHGGEQ